MHATPATMTNDDAAGDRGQGNASGAMRWPDCATLSTAEIVDLLTDNPLVLDAIGAELRANEISDAWNTAYAVLRAVLESECDRIEFMTLKLEAAKITLDLAGHIGWRQRRADIP
jgi:hypothetical protein